MTQIEKYEILSNMVMSKELYSIAGLQRVLYSLGHEISCDDLYVALKSSGWIKLRLIRDRLLETKRNIPKGNPFGGLRQIAKWPLLVDRNADLPEYTNEDLGCCVD